MSRMTGFEPKVPGHKDCTRKGRQKLITVQIGVSCIELPTVT